MTKLLIITLFTLSCYAKTYIVNPEHSLIKFSIAYMGFSDVEGRFKRFNLYYELDGDTISDISGQIEVDSIDTNDKKRDSHLKKKDFFYSQKFPIIEVKLASPIKLKKENKLPIFLTIRDHQKQVILNLKYLGARKDPWTKSEGLYFKGTTQISRKDFGIVWNKMLDDGSGFLIGDQVNISFNIEAYHSNQRPAFSRFYKPQNVKKKQK